jgi:hypothetical protein
MVLHEQLLVARVVGGVGGLEPLDLRQHVLIHRGHQDVGRISVVERDAGHHVRDHEPLEVLLMVDRVLHRQEPAPRLPEEHEVVPIQAERLPHLLHLIDEPRQFPQ